MFGSENTTLMISNEKKNDFMKIIKSLEESGLLNKALVKQLKMKHKNKKDDSSEFYKASAFKFNGVYSEIIYLK